LSVEFSVSIIHGRYDTETFDLMAYGIWGHCGQECFFWWHLEKEDTQLNILRWLKDYLNYRAKRDRRIQFYNAEWQRRYRSWIVDTQTFLFLAEFNQDYYTMFLRDIACNYPTSVKTEDLEAMFDTWKKLILMPNPRGARLF
jgi:hypothetical protein